MNQKWKTNSKSIVISSLPGSQKIYIYMMNPPPPEKAVKKKADTYSWSPSSVRPLCAAAASVPRRGGGGRRTQEQVRLEAALRVSRMLMLREKAMLHRRSPTGCLTAGFPSSSSSSRPPKPSTPPPPPAPPPKTLSPPRGDARCRLQESPLEGAVALMGDRRVDAVLMLPFEASRKAVAPAPSW